MKRQAVLQLALTTSLIRFATMGTGLAQPAPASAPAGEALIQVAACNAQPQYAPGAFFSPALAPAGPGPFLAGEDDGPLYALLAPAPIGGALSIDYTNATNRAMKMVDFGLIAGDTLVAEVRDAGTFSPNAEIKHDFVIDTNAFSTRNVPQQCVPLHIVYSDGTTWTNPHQPGAPR